MFEKGEVHSVLLDNKHGQPIAPLEVRSVHGDRLLPADCHRQRKKAAS